MSLALLGVLVLAPTTAQASVGASATTSTNPLVDYVAMGDSYASGTSLGHYGSSGSCRRSSKAYAHLLGSQFSGVLQQLQPNLVACDGATTSDVAENQLGSLSRATDLVTISVGGDDLKFGDLIKDCVLSGLGCSADVRYVADTASAILTPRLTALYKEIRERVRSDTRVEVIGYPRLFRANPHNESFRCRDIILAGIQATEQRAANHLADVLNQVIGAAAGAAHFGYVNSIPIFAVHDLCSHKRYLNAFIGKHPTESFHPTALGHRVWAKAIVAALISGPPPGPPPPAPPPSHPTPAIAAGGFDSCALLATGHLKCWGDNASGQLGNGTSATVAQSRTPVDVSEITNATAIATGLSYACALLEGGQVKCWGSNASGQLGNATTIDSSTPVDVSTITNATAISTGGDHTCALLSSGHIKCWGNNNSGQLGNATTTNSSTPLDVSTITNATAITTGAGHSCALLPSGQVKCWGSNVYGQLGDGTTTSSSTPVDVSEITNATAITGGLEDSCALLASGQVRCWGHNTYGQLGNATTTDSSTPVNVSEITNASAITAGDWHTCALLTGGQIQCWGLNGFGQLGDGTSTNSWHGPDSSTPVDVSAISDATAIATGSLHSCAQLTSGQIKCWGAQARGELGNDSEYGSSTPVAVLEIP